MVNNINNFNIIKSLIVKLFNDRKIIRLLNK